jgi:hypothetical protein
MTRSIIDDYQNLELNVVFSATYFHLGKETVYKPAFKKGDCDPSLGI